MRETRGPKIIKYQSLEWLVRFLNLKIESRKAADKKEVEAALGKSWQLDDVAVVVKAQQKIVDLTDLALKANSPEGLIMELNHYIAENSESDPRRRHSPVRPHWYAQPLESIQILKAGWAVLKMGPRKWVVHPAHSMPDPEGGAWLSIIQCLENGDFQRLRRCLLGGCKRFFETKDARQKFCCHAHQREHDREASKERVKQSRARQKANSLGLASPKRKPKEAPVIPITEERRFAEFLTMAGGNVIYESNLALLITRIPGKWVTVNKWLAQSKPPVWADLQKPTKSVFRKEWGLEY